jgi:hypothetical protein
MWQQKTRVLDYRNQRPRTVAIAWQSIVASAGGYLFIPTFMCPCGHLGPDALLATVPTLLLSWWGFARPLSLVGRLFAGAVTVLASAVFLKNALDIGWFGHDPMFG